MSSTGYLGRDVERSRRDEDIARHLPPMATAVGLPAYFAIVTTTNRMPRPS